MPRYRRPENKALPSRCRWRRGVIYYDVPKGQEHLWNGKTLYRLGTNLTEMYRTLADKTERKTNVRTIEELLDRYAIEVVPTKAPLTAKGNMFQIVILKRVFGAGALTSIEPQHIYQYLDKKKAKVAGKREIALLSHAFTKAVEWGYISKHPFKGEVRTKNAPARTRYIEDWEIIECLSLPSTKDKGGVKVVQAYIRLKLLLGLRMSDMLRLKVSDCKPEYLEANNQKTKKPTRYAWTDALRNEIENVKAVRPVDISPFLFCTKSGKGYIKAVDKQPAGFKSLWERFMVRVIKETAVTEWFTEHDLRAKAGSDAKTLEEAQKLLAHADSRTTKAVYRRKIEIINPAR